MQSCGEGTRVMIIGMGVLGYSTIEILSRNPSLGEGIRIIGADTNEEMGLRKVNLAIAAAEALGCHPNIEFTHINLLDVDSSAEVLEKCAPDLIFQCASLLSWHGMGSILGYLPMDNRRRFDEAAGGPWAPMSTLLPYNLMQAVRKAGLGPVVVNASWPDVVCPTLGKIGLAPTVGIGNLSLAVPLIKMATSRKLGVPIRDISLFMVGSHYVGTHILSDGSTNGAPYYLRILVNGEDVTQEIDPNHRLGKEGMEVPILPTDRVTLYSLVSATAVEVIQALLKDTLEVVHAPSPRGLPGGYPVRLGREVAEVTLPDDISLEEAIEINQQGNRHDGIERIEDDGTIVVTSKSREIMRDLLGYDAAPFNIRDSEQRARELGRVFRKYSEAAGIPESVLASIYTG